jgi:hypothetical protein
MIDMIQKDHHLIVMLDQPFSIIKELFDGHHPYHQPNILQNYVYLFLNFDMNLDFMINFQIFLNWDELIFNC